MGQLRANRRLAVVTGASSGIGFELAKLFAQNGFDLLITAEDGRVRTAAAEIEKTGALVKAVQVDLAEPGGADQLWREIQITAPVAAIALNAGVGVDGDFTREASWEDERRLLELNVVSMVRLAKLAAREMVGRGEGRILITSSNTGTMPTPLEAVYGASKAFDLSFAASLRQDLKGTGVTVTALTSGPTDTDLFERAGLSDAKSVEEAKSNPRS
jgi:short-subunit dehydrogenase